MRLTATYTFGQALLTVLEFALLFFWIWIAISVVADLLRSHDLSGWAKAGWLLLIVLLPLLGVMIYIIARGDKMRAHALSQQRLAGISSVAELQDLRDRGILTDAEFQRASRESQSVRGAPPSPDDDVADLEALRARGILSDEEFQSAKRRAMPT